MFYVWFILNVRRDAVSNEQIKSSKHKINIAKLSIVIIHMIGKCPQHQSVSDKQRD